MARVFIMQAASFSMEGGGGPSGILPQWSLIRKPQTGLWRLSVMREVETAIMSGVKSRFGITVLSTSDNTLGLWLCL